MGVTYICINIYVCTPCQPTKSNIYSIYLPFIFNRILSSPCSSCQPTSSGSSISSSSKPFFPLWTVATAVAFAVINCLKSALQGFSYHILLLRGFHALLQKGVAGVFGRLCGSDTDLRLGHDAGYPLFALLDFFLPFGACSGSGYGYGSGSGESSPRMSMRCVNFAFISQRQQQKLPLFFIDARRFFVPAAQELLQKFLQLKLQLVASRRCCCCSCCCCSCCCCLLNFP